MGGLGNQLFQYMLARVINIQTGKQIKLDITSYSGDVIRKFNLINIVKLPHEFFLNEKYTINNYYDKVLFSFCKKLRKNFGGRAFEQNLSYDSSLIDNVNFIKSYFGYWQSPKYFSDKWDDIKSDINLEKFCRRELSLKYPEINSDKSVSIHIRRCDYLNDSVKNYHKGVCDSEYYVKAIEYIKHKVEQPYFYIFSDDIDWCKQYFKIKEDHDFIDSTVNEFEDLLLMHKCAHNIIANSTYSWWAAFLNTNKEKIIIAPKTWFNNNMSIDIVPFDWIRL